MSVRTYLETHETCPATGKRSYVTRAKAATFAHAVGRKNRGNGDRHQVHEYQCPHCQRWHIGHHMASGHDKKRREALVRHREAFA